MKPAWIQRILSSLGGVLGIVGALLLLGSFVVWQIGLETLSGFYDNNKPLVYAALAGVGLLVLGIIFSILAGHKGLTATTGMASLPGAMPEGSVRCGKCQSINDPHAKFCDQCGVALTGQ